MIQLLHPYLDKKEGLRVLVYHKKSDCFYILITKLEFFRNRKINKIQNGRQSFKSGHFLLYVQYFYELSQQSSKYPVISFNIKC